MNLAVFLPNWIGDVVMATPAVRALRARFPTARMIGVCRPYVSGILSGTPWFDDLLFLDRRGPWASRWPSVAWQLRKAKPDLTVLFPNSFRSALVAWAAGSRRVVGYNRYGRGWMLNERLAPLRDNRGHLQPTPVIDDYNRLAEAAGTAAPGFRMELHTTPQDDDAAERVWQTCKFGQFSEVICLNPGAAFGASKHWDTTYFVELARQLADRRGAGVLVLCGPSERDIAREITVRAERGHVHSLADTPLSLGLSKALVRRCTLLITTDSGPRHFAAAFDRPVVTLFGPTHIAWTETYFAKAIHLQRSVPCGPCQERVCPTGDHRCMKELLPDEVFAAAVRLLDDRLGNPHGGSHFRADRKAS